MAQKNPLDRVPRRQRRGRPPKIDPHFVRGSADTYRVLLERSWNELERLLVEPADQKICDLIQSAFPNNLDPPRLASLIVEAMNEPTFPKRKRARINFIADSIAGHGLVTLRRSRDICTEQRAADAKRHMILRYEYWIECSCGYKGRSEHHCCKKCGAVIYFPVADSEFA
jgi:hypothetical protein